MNQLKQLQQGDVNIIAISAMPNDNDKLRKLNSDVVREGETTGHAHRIVGSDFQLYQLGQLLFARILSGDCSIVHEEHKTIELPEGDYMFTPTVEYDHFTERSVRVRD